MRRKTCSSLSRRNWWKWTFVDRLRVWRNSD